MDENPYREPPGKSDGNPTRPSYDPFAVWRKVSRLFWSAAFAMYLLVALAVLLLSL